MDFSFTPEQEIFRRTVREFADRYIRPHIPEMEEKKEIPRDVFDKIAQQGYYGLRYPEEVGGQGGDNVLFAIFVEEMARCYMSTAARASTHGIRRDSVKNAIVPENPCPPNQPRSFWAP